MKNVSLLIFGLLLMCGNIIGGFVLTRSVRANNQVRFVQAVLGVGAGFMLTAVFLEIFPRVFAAWSNTDAAHTEIDSHKHFAVPMMIVVSGYLIMYFTEQFIAPHISRLSGLITAAGREKNEREKPAAPDTAATFAAKTAYTAIGGLAAHTFFDGVLLGTGLLVSYEFGLLLFIALFLHKLPEGFTAASVMLAAGATGRQALTATAFIGAATFAGILLVALLDESIRDFTRYALPLSAGITLYVVASDLIPEMKRRGANLVAAIGVLGGVMLFYLLHTLLDIH